MRSLAVDLGGTHVRFRLGGHEARPAPVHVVEAGTVASFEDALARWRETTGVRGRIDVLAVAAAGPVADGQVRITNLGWRLDARAIECSGDVGRCLLVNDLAAVAWAIPALGGGDLRRLDARGPSGGAPGGADTPGGRRAEGAHPEAARSLRREAMAEPHAAGGSPRPGSADPGRRAPRAVLAPGTGLGVSGLVPVEGGDFAVIEGEGGHRTLAAHNPREWAIVSALAERFGHASAERALSGPGIEALWRAIATIDGLPGPGGKSAAEIARAAFRRSDPIAVEAVATFTGLLGSVAGDLALTLGARGGVYLAGGIVPGWGKRFDAVRFLDRFRAKGRFREYLSTIPVYVVAHPYPVLAGLESLLARHRTGACRLDGRS